MARSQIIDDTLRRAGANRASPDPGLDALIDEMSPRQWLTELGGQGEGGERLRAHMRGADYPKVWIDGARCERCGGVLEMMYVKAAVGPRGASRSTPSQRVETVRERGFPFVATRVLVDAGGTCGGCGGRIVFETRELSDEEMF